jgi:hypothetical protein
LPTQERAAADELRNRLRREEEKAIRLQIEAERARLKAERAAAAALAPASPAKVSAASTMLPPSPLRVTTRARGESMGGGMESGGVSGDGIPPEVITPRRAAADAEALRADAPPSSSRLLQVLWHNVWLIAAALTLIGGLLYAYAVRPPSTDSEAADAVSRALSAPLHALYAVYTSLFVLSTSITGVCEVHAPAQILTTFSALTQPSFASSTFALSQTQPMAVRLITQGLHLSLASSVYHDTPNPPPPPPLPASTSAAASAAASKAAPASSGSASAPAPTPAPATVSEAELAKRIVRNRSNSMTVMHFAGSAQVCCHVCEGDVWWLRSLLHCFD